MKGVSSREYNTGRRLVMSLEGTLISSVVTFRRKFEDSCSLGGQSPIYPRFKTLEARRSFLLLSLRRSHALSRQGIRDRPHDERHFLVNRSCNLGPEGVALSSKVNACRQRTYFLGSTSAPRAMSLMAVSSHSRTRTREACCPARVEMTVKRGSGNCFGVRRSIKLAS